MTVTGPLAPAVWVCAVVGAFVLTSGLLAFALLFVPAILDIARERRAQRQIDQAVALANGEDADAILRRWVKEGRGHA